MLKTIVLLNIFVETFIIIETFSCPFDQFNAPLLNKMIHFLKKNLADQKRQNINIKTCYTVQKGFFYYVYK